MLINLRKKTGLGPRKLLGYAKLSRPGVPLPAVSTVSSILSRAGLVDPQPRRRRSPELRGIESRYQAGEHPNEQWTVDFKGQFRLGDRSLAYPLTVQDDASRYVLCVDVYPGVSTEAVLRSFRRIFQEYGIPARIHSDNGTPFASSGLLRLSRVNVEWMRQGVEVRRSRPGCPQDNPRHERMHRTLKDETACPPCMTRSAQQGRSTRFRRWMNTERLHEGIGMKTPAEVYRPSQRPWKARPAEPEYPGHWEIRRVKRGGDVRLHGTDLFLTQALSGEMVGLEAISDGIWRVSYRSTVLCFLDVRGGSPVVLGASPEDA